MRNITKEKIKSQKDSIKESSLRRTGQSAPLFTHRLRQLTQDYGQRFSPRFLLHITYSSKTSAKFLHLRFTTPRKNFQRCVRCGEIFEAKWRVTGEKVERLRRSISRFSPNSCQLKKASDRLSPVYCQDSSRSSPFKNCTHKSASPAGVPRGCNRRKNLVRRCMTPPWNDLKLSEISFINPLRFAPIANATSGLIQATMLHSHESSLGGDSV